MVLTLIFLKALTTPESPYGGFHQTRPKNIMVLIIGTTKMGPLIFGNSHIATGPGAWSLLPDIGGAVS